MFKRKKKQKRWELSDTVAAGLVGTSPTYTPLSRCPEVITAVDKIADLISNMTIHLMRNTDQGDVRECNELSKKIDINPCTGMTKKSFIHFIVRTLLLEGDGNAVVIPQYSKEGYIDNLLPVPAKDFSIIPGKTFQDGYKIQIGNKLYDPENLLHFRINPDPDTLWVGRSYRIALKELVSTLSAGESVKQSFMKGRYMPSIIIRVDSDTELLFGADNQERLVDKYLGAEKVGKPWVIPSEIMDIESITPLSLNDIGVVDSLAQDKETLAALLGVPSFLVGVGEFNVDEYNNFVKDKVLSVAKEIEQTLTSQLLLSPDLYFKFNVRSLYAYDIETLANVGGSMYDKGIMTGNEVRDWVGLSPTKETADFKILENYIPPEDSGNQKKLNNEDTDAWF